MPFHFETAMKHDTSTALSFIIIISMTHRHFFSFFFFSFFYASAMEKYTILLIAPLVDVSPKKCSKLYLEQRISVFCRNVVFPMSQGFQGCTIDCYGV